MKIANGFCCILAFWECLEDEGRVFEDGTGNKRGKEENFHCIYQHILCKESRI